MASRALAWQVALWTRANSRIAIDRELGYIVSSFVSLQASTRPLCSEGWERKPKRRAPPVALEGHDGESRRWAVRRPADDGDYGAIVKLGNDCPSPDCGAEARESEEPCSIW